MKRFARSTSPLLVVVVALLGAVTVGIVFFAARHEHKQVVKEAIREVRSEEEATQVARALDEAAKMDAYVRSTAVRIGRLSLEMAHDKLKNQAVAAEMDDSVHRLMTLNNAKVVDTISVLEGANQIALKLSTELVKQEAPDKLLEDANMLRVFTSVHLKPFAVCLATSKHLPPQLAAVACRLNVQLNMPFEQVRAEIDTTLGNIEARLR